MISEADARILPDLAATDESAHFPGMISPSQCRAARGLLHWSQTELAENAGVSRSTVMEYERGNSIAPESKTKITDAFEDAGVRPLHADQWGGEGVRFVK